MMKLGIEVQSVTVQVLVVLGHLLQERRMEVNLVLGHWCQGGTV